MSNLGIRTGISAGLLALLLLSSGCGSIGEHLFVPGALQGQPAGIVPPSNRYELLSLRTHDGTRIEAEFGKALDANGLPLPDFQERPTVLLFYANSMSMRLDHGLFEDFRRLGVNVIMPDYPGYGMSEGRPSEKGCYAAADAVYDYALSRPDIEHQRILAAGWSLGAAVAVDLGSRRHLAGLVLLGVFTNLREVGRNTFPWAIRWNVPLLTSRCKMDNLSKMPAVTCPVLIVHGTRDPIATPTMAQELASAAKTEVTILPVEGAQHFDLVQIGGEALWQKIREWVGRRD